MAELTRNWKTVLPFVVGVLSFVVLGIFDHMRGFFLWRNYAFSGVLLGGTATYILYRLDVRLPKYIQWTIVAALWTHYGGGSLGSPNPYKMGLLGMHGVNGAYHHFDWWDHLTHGVGIGASAMGIAYLFEVYQVRRGFQWSGSTVWIATMLASMTAGVGVELYEFLGRTAFQTIDQGGYENTMRDLHFNLMGALVGATTAVTVHRSKFAKRIREKWAPDETVSPREPWYRRVTPSMTGFLVFCAIPAATALYLSTQFFSMDIPADDLHLYDAALLTLTISAAAAIAVAPGAAWLHRRLG